MDYRGLIVMSACLSAGLVPLLPACKGPDPGAISFEERPSSSGSDTLPGTSSSSSSGTVDVGDASTEGGAVVITDVFKDPKTGTVAPFAYTAPDTVVNTATHGAETAPMQGKTCVKTGCHADAPKWGAGGTVYGDINGAAFPDDQKKKVEIRILQPDGTIFGGTSFWPDDDGNFFLRSDDKFPPAGSRVGIRVEGGQTKMMIAPIEGAAGANCSSAGCHEAMRVVAK